MKYFLDVMRVLGFRSRALRSLAARSNCGAALIALAIGLIVYALVRNSVYAALIRAPYVMRPLNVLESFLDSNLLQAFLFLSLIYVPALIALGNSLAGDGLGFSISRAEYERHLSALLPLWGILFLGSAPIQWLEPRFLMLSLLEISVGMFCLLLLLMIYTVWAIRELNYLSTMAAAGVFALSWFTLPVFLLLCRFMILLPVFIIFPLFLVFLQQLRELLEMRFLLKGFRKYLVTLRKNPKDADAHFQLGLLHFKSGHPETAQGYFDEAIAIDPAQADYHYYMGRILEQREEWPEAAERYEETYRLDREYSDGDISREVGKCYLHTGHPEKAAEFLRFFLERRGADPEGRYWLAEALHRTGEKEEMRSHLNRVLDQARTNPRIFRKANRAWIYRSRLLLRESIP